MNKSIIWITFALIFGILGKGLAKSESLEQNSPLSINLSAERTNCPNDPNGSATVTALGGKSPYSYNWSNGGTTATISNLIAGGYFITVTDAMGSTITSHVAVEATNILELRFDQRAITCFNQNDAKVVAIPEGGLPPYTYLWGDGTNRSFIENVGPGRYEITVTDANGCRAEETVDVITPEQLKIEAEFANVSCGAEADGFMNVSASGGAPPYFYVWELDGQGGTHREGLAPGLYSVTVTDANGCTNMICPEITQSQDPLLSASSIPETCPGEGDGRGTVTANGDSPPYTYQWPNNESDFGTAFNLSPGSYIVTVTNFRNCSSTIEVVVEQAGGGFGFEVATNGATCGNEANGAAAVEILGGVAPFSYQWVNENTNTVISLSLIHISEPTRPY